MTERDFDALVIGGGVNGCGIARDLAGRGLSVLLAEKADLAQATSSSSSKLIHGGLRYLEMYEFRLVREALAEREVLLKSAPHIIWPLRFVLPHRPEMRPRWVIRAGLFLYDHLARRATLPGAESFATAGHALAAPLKRGIAHAYAYSDAWVEDARLVVLCALDAARRGADIRPRTEFVAAERGAEGWTATLRGTDGAGLRVRAKALVNAAGPWVERAVGGAPAAGKVRLVRGSHIVLPRLYAGEHAYILQNDDRRVVFVIPYEGKYSLVGTTDVPHEGDPSEAVCTPEEAAYLCRAVSNQFERPVSPGDIVWSYSGVRPLFDDGADNPSAVTRDYVLKLDEAAAPLLTVYGGKITTFRRLAEEAADKLVRALGRGGKAWTRDAALPGGDLGGYPLDLFEAEMARRFPWLPEAWVPRLVRTHGGELPKLLAGATSRADLGEHFGGGLTEREIQHFERAEWARTAEDVLWRRTRLGLHLDEAEKARVAERMGALPVGAA
jgi:glycerol-3-phosphate dehydrogenase